MALRIRKDGRIFCAALHPPKDGDTYIDDGLHYEMSVIHRVIYTDPEPIHSQHGEWWWSGRKHVDHRAESKREGREL